jgi:hypothetical protein
MTLYQFIQLVQTGALVGNLFAVASIRMVSRAFESRGESAGPSSFIYKEHIFGAIERAMSNSSKRKPTSNRNQRPRELISDQAQKGGWTVKAIASKSMSTIIVVIGIAGLIVFIPRVTIEPSGDISNPSSISFKVKNMGNIPLRNPLMSTLGCRIGFVLGDSHGIPPEPKE